MATKRSPKKMPTTVEPEIKTKPVRVDLLPAVHKALRLKAAGHDESMAAMARRIISEHLGFKDKGGK
jgi:plasmid stability protein